MATAFRGEGGEFMSAVTKEMEKHKTHIRRGRIEIHRDQAIVERFNHTPVERLFGKLLQADQEPWNQTEEWQQLIEISANS